MHTHATESYEAYDAAVYDTRNSWRTTDNNENMVAVGDALADALTAAGIGVVHDTQQFDYPSYNGSYDRAAEVIRQYQARYPDLQLILDVHRDGIQRDASTIVKPVTEIDGEAAAQIMILCGSDSSIPDWGENLRTAAAVTNLLETRYPSLMRPIFFSTGRYNMDFKRPSAPAGVRLPGQYAGGGPHLRPAHRRRPGRLAEGARRPVNTHTHSDTERSLPMTDRELDALLAEIRANRPKPPPDPAPPPPEPELHAGWTPPAPSSGRCSSR